MKVPGVRNPRSDRVAPTQPQNLTAEAASSSVVTLSWSASTDAFGVYGYQLWRDGIPITTTTLLGHVMSGLDAATTYLFQVSAFDEAGNMSTLSDVAAATTFEETENLAPVWSAVPQQELTVGTSYSFNLGPLCIDPNGNVPSIVIYSGTLPGETSGEASDPWDGSWTGWATSAWSTSGEATSALIYNETTKIISGTPLTPETTTVVFRASDGELTADKSITFNVLNADTTAPSTPTGVTATAVSTSRIDLTWEASTDPTVANARTGGVAGYRIFRDNLFRANAGNVLAWSDTNLPADTTFAYRVLAYDVANNVSIWSNPAVSATTDAVAPTFRYTPGHYVSMLRSSSQADMTAASTTALGIPKGFVRRYTWRSFETAQGVYTSATHQINSDLAYCQARGLKLIAMIEHRTFGYADNIPNPDYLESKTGLVPQTGDMNGDGYTIAIWDPVVVTRLKALLTEIATQFGDHPALEGVMIEETSLGIPATQLTTPPTGKDWITYTAERYRDALISIMAHWAVVQPDVRWFFYFNYMSGNTSGTYLEQAVQAADNCVICGPDAQELDGTLQTRTFWIYRNNNTIRPVAAFASTRVYGTAVSGADIYDFAVNDLGADYLMWAYLPPSSPNYFNWTDKALPQIQTNPTWPWGSW